MIKEFKGDYRFLSNFYACNIQIDSEDEVVDVFPSVEHGYQAYKAVNDEDFEKIRTAPSAAMSKKLGSSVNRSPEGWKAWDEQKIYIMHILLEAKFEIPELRAKLLATDGHELVEGNYWNDKFWGFCLKTNEGENHLGKLLMQIRSDIIQKEKHKI